MLEHNVREPIVKKRIFDVVGESFENSDGTSRQKSLANCNPGDVILLERQPHNKHGSNAIFVKTHSGHGLGYISSADSKILAPILDTKRIYRAQIHELRGGIDDFETERLDAWVPWQFSLVPRFCYC